MLSLFTLFSFLLALLGTASADVFMANASLPGNALDGLPVNAAGEAFFLGGSPATYCPTVVGVACPNATAQTIVAAGFTALDVSTLLLLLFAVLIPTPG
jgi:hypothetical protein